MNWYELLFYKYIKGAQGQPKLRIMMPVFKGGTEQVLPENGSTPTTAPIIADIRYPDALRTDQTFLYRESPTQESGNARLRRIKGNTLVWNQLVENGNFAVDSRWVVNGGSKTIANNSLTITANDANPYLVQTTSNIKANHKYLIMFDATCSIRQQFIFHVAWSSGNFVSTAYAEANTKTRLSAVLTPTVTPTAFNIYMAATEIGATAKLENVQIFDLTVMGFDSITVNEFTLLFPSPYYEYNQKTLLTFNGIGIKTTGKNLLSYSGENLPYNANGVSITRENNIYKIVASDPSGYPFARISTIHYLPKGQYTITMLGAESSSTGIAWRLIDRNVSPVKIFVNASATNTTFTLNEDAHDVYFEITIDASKLTTGTWDVRFQLNMGTPSDYEPYASTVTDLPISTYFPTGMKRAGNVYDELTESKAITRIGIIDLGSMSWTAITQNNITRMRSYDIKTLIKYPSANNQIANMVCAKYSTLTANNTYDGQIGISCQNNGDIYVYDSAYSTAEAFKSAMSGVYLYYELATETETPITTEDSNEALSLLMGKSVSSSNAKQMIDIITKGE